MEARHPAGRQPRLTGRCPEFVTGLREEFVHELHAGEMAEQCTVGM